VTIVPHRPRKYVRGPQHRVEPADAESRFRKDRGFPIVGAPNLCDAHAPLLSLFLQ
jgi:hypothetical protein